MSPSRICVHTWETVAQNLSHKRDISLALDGTRISHGNPKEII